MPKGLFFTIDNEKKSRIIEAATREFSCKMYDKASINQIIKGAEISRGSFYQYFEDKDDLYFFVIKTIVDATSYTFLKDFLTSKPEDIFSVYESLFVYNIRLMSDRQYHGFFKNMYLSMNYSLQQELRKIFCSVRNEMLEGKLDEIRIKSGYERSYFQELMNILELVNRDLLMLYISDSIDKDTIMECYHLRLRIFDSCCFSLCCFPACKGKYEKAVYECRTKRYRQSEVKRGSRSTL